jgi:hypothetical protein
MDNVSNYIMIGICMVIILFFLVWVMFTNYETTDKSIVYLTCNPSQCSVNIYNGQKRCPKNDTDVIIYDPSFENCTSRYTCDSSIVPYAVNSDGSTNDLGYCETNITCLCAANPQCPIGEVVLFNIVGNNIYAENNTDLDIIFNQVPVQNIGNNQPIVYNNPNQNLCSIPANYLNLISPGSCVFSNPNNISTDEIVSCISSNPCVLGVMAFKPSNISTFNLSYNNNSAIYRTPVGCVLSGLTPNGVSSKCTGINQVPVWDASIGDVFCYTVN